MLPVILVAGLLATACGAATTATPRPTDTPQPATPQAADAPRAAALPTTDKPAPVEKPDAISEEQSWEELKRARFSTDEWSRTNFRVRSVPLREFRGGGPGKDDIPPIDAPKFETVAQAERWPNDREAVQVVEIKGDARAYPQQILIWNEVVNDTVGGEPVTVTY
jgi:hypothetical protein